MIGFCFPLPHEGKELVAQLTDVDEFRIGDLSCVTGKLDTRPVVIAYLGMGIEASRASTMVLLDHFRLKAVILAGYGGALVPQLKKGQVALSDNFTSEEVVQFVRFMSGFVFVKFVSADGVLTTPAMKKMFFEQTQCQVVDMETVAVSDVVSARNIPFIAIRGISDESNEVLPPALSKGYDQEMQRMTPFRLMWYLFRHKQEIAAFQQFVVQLAPVRKNLTAFLVDLNKELPRSW